MNQREIPYFAFEAVLSRFERTIRRLWILLIILVVLLVGSNIAWLVYESQFETAQVTAEQEADGDGTNYAIGGDFNGSPAKGDDQLP